MTLQRIIITNTQSPCNLIFNYEHNSVALSFTIMTGQSLTRMKQDKSLMKEQQSILHRCMTKQETETLKRNSTSDLEKEFIKYFDEQAGPKTYLNGNRQRSDRQDFLLDDMQHLFKYPELQRNTQNRIAIKEEEDMSSYSCSYSSKGSFLYNFNHLMHFYKSDYCDSIWEKNISLTLLY